MLLDGEGRGHVIALNKTDRFMYYSGSLTEQSHVKVVGPESRSSLRSEWVHRQGFDLKWGDSIDTAVCMKQQTGTEVCSVQCASLWRNNNVIS